MFRSIRFTARALSLATLLAMAIPARAADPISILPLGDSITAGSAGGYRKPLLKTLTDTHGLTVTTVGSQTDPDLPAGQQAHEGHGGWRIDQLNDNLLGHNAVDKGSNGGYWLHGGHDTGRGPIKPTFVTLMAGINDLGSMIDNGTGKTMADRSHEIDATLQTRYRALVETLTTQLPDSTILLGGCIPYNNGLLDEKKTGATKANRDRWAQETNTSPEQHQGVNHWVIRFNRWIKETYVPELQKAGKKVAYVDLYAPFILPDGTVRGWNNDEPERSNGPAAYADYGLHPNRFGYGLIADAWARAIVEHVSK